LIDSKTLKEDQEESFVKPLLENHGGTTPELSQLMQQERLQAISGTLWPMPKGVYSLRSSRLKARWSPAYSWVSFFVLSSVMVAGLLWRASHMEALHLLCLFPCLIH